MTKNLLILFTVISINLFSQSNALSCKETGIKFLIRGTALNIGGGLISFNYTNTNAVNSTQLPSINTQSKYYCFVPGITLTITGITLLRFSKKSKGYSIAK